MPGALFRERRLARFEEEAERTGRRRGTPGNPVGWSVAWVAGQAQVSSDLISLYERSNRATPENIAALWRILGEPVPGDMPEELATAVTLSYPNKVDFRTSGDPFHETDNVWQGAPPYVTLTRLSVSLHPGWHGPVELTYAQLKMPQITQEDVFEWFQFADLSPGQEGFHGLTGAVAPARIVQGGVFTSDVVFFCERLRASLTHASLMSKLEQLQYDPLTITVSLRLKSVQDRRSVNLTYDVYLPRSEIMVCFDYCRQHGREVPRWMQVVPLFRKENVRAV